MSHRTSRIKKTQLLTVWSGDRHTLPREHLISINNEQLTINNWAKRLKELTLLALRFLPSRSFYGCLLRLDIIEVKIPTDRCFLERGQLEGWNVGQPTTNIN